jgi:hypothetical protein
MRIERGTISYGIPPNLNTQAMATRSSDSMCPIMRSATYSGVPTVIRPSSFNLRGSSAFPLDQRATRRISGPTLMIRPGGPALVQKHSRHRD